MKINIIGGGIIGLFSAWSLREAGHEVHVFDRSDLTDNCSYGNAGMITPSHFVPLAAPGMVAQGLRRMFRDDSPFYVKPRFDGALAQWLWRFYRSCSQKQTAAAMPVLLDFILESKKRYLEFNVKTGNGFQLEERGIVILFKTAKNEKDELAVAETAARMGIETKRLDRHAVGQLETGTEVDVPGGVLWPCDAHLYPNLLMAHLIKILKNNGVLFHLNKPITGFEKKARKINAIIAGKEIYRADATVVAAGSWSAILLKKLGARLLLQGGKGYSMTFRQPKERPRMPAILSEAKVAVTPLGNDLRLGGTLELSGLDFKINIKRARAIVSSFKEYYPRLEINMPDKKNIWYGFRPCSPDGLPYIGRLKKYDNLIVATGHAMLGLTLAPSTGALVRDMILE
ncbi:MAG TPA: FAD-dependent oxidoreductase, partial [Bacteroidetes bacterium]|nr:FAD-dependent oxidoreductase [Bacteroidota bacterium]